MRFLFLIFIISFCMASCNNEDGFPKTISIEMTPLDDSLDLGRPMDLDLINDWLVWQDHHDQYYYSGYKINTKETIRFAKVGNGKNEFSMWPKGNASTLGLGILNQQKKTFTTWEIDSVITNNHYYPSYSSSINDSLGLVFSIAQRVDSSFVATGINEKGLFAFFNKNGELSNISGRYPEKPDQKEDISDQHHAIAYLNSTYTYSPELDKIAIAYLFSGQFEVFEFKGDNAILQWNVEKFPFEYKVRNERVSVPLSTKYGYVDIDCTASYIYTLFSGKTRSIKTSDYSNIIEVYNWEGKRVAKLQLNTLVNFIAVTPDNKNIYCTGIKDKKITIYGAKLPEL